MMIAIYISSSIIELRGTNQVGLNEPRLIFEAINFFTTWRARLHFSRQSVTLKISNYKVSSWYDAIGSDVAAWMKNETSSNLRNFVRFHQTSDTIEMAGHNPRHPRRENQLLSSVKLVLDPRTKLRSVIIAPLAHGMPRFHPGSGR